MGKLGLIAQPLRAPMREMLLSLYIWLLGLGSPGYTQGFDGALSSTLSNSFSQVSFDSEGA